MEADKELARLQAAVAAQQAAVAKAAEADTAARKALRDAEAEEAAITVKILAAPVASGSAHAVPLSFELPPELCRRADAEVAFAARMDSIQQAWDERERLLERLLAQGGQSSTVDGSSAAGDQPGAPVGAVPLDGVDTQSLASDLPDLADLEAEEKWSSVPVRKRKALLMRERDRLAASAMRALRSTKMVRTGSLFAKAATPASLRDYGPELAAQLCVSSAA